MNIEIYTQINRWIQAYIDGDRYRYTLNYYIAMYTVDMYHMQEQTQRLLQHEVLIKEAAGDTHTHTHKRVCV